MTRLGAIKDSEEILSHPFFADLDLMKLQIKELKAPFIPKTPDFEKLRAQVGKLVSFKDFQETIIPTQGMELINFKKEEFERAFGVIDESDPPQKEMIKASTQK